MFVVQIFIKSQMHRYKHHKTNQHFSNFIAPKLFSEFIIGYPETWILSVFPRHCTTMRTHNRTHNGVVFHVIC